MLKRVNAGIAQRGGHFHRCFLFPYFSIICILTHKLLVKSGKCDFSIILHKTIFMPVVLNVCET
jgi:hypothetical protein